MLLVSPNPEHNRKGGRIKIFGVLQLPVSISKTSTEMGAGHRPKQAKPFLTPAHKGWDYSLPLHCLGSGGQKACGCSTA